MSKLMILAIFGYSILTLFMVLSHDYMDAFVALTIDLIFIFGLRESLSNEKSGNAHAITGSILGIIFGVYYIIAIFASAFDGLINEGIFQFKSLSTFLIVLILLPFNMYLFFHFKIKFSAKVK